MIYFKIKDNFGNWLFRYAAALSTQDLLPPEIEIVPCRQDAIPFLHGIGRLAAKKIGLLKR